ncbi:hypothetical protein FIBSPDRAFT_870026 [Athelia psychrophila]|uniref:Uncharacterized protein n=1 Tax=Athelia psychrophila TaxID=1759441 RepID=A0A166BH94_9AGAM|nr:hypothetical protein FIBSPDRAFT_870026 [Fibularhizoctonia sp. CBS 109695]
MEGARMMIGRGKRDGDMRVMNGHRKRHKRGNTKETRKESDKERHRTLGHDETRPNLLGKAIHGREAEGERT